MVAKAIGKTSAQRFADTGDDGLESGLKDNIVGQLRPLFNRLKNRWVLLGLFLAAYTPFGLSYMTAYQDYTVLQTRISGQEAVLALPEPQTSDIEAGLKSWTSAREAAQEAQVFELIDSDLVERFVATANSAGVSMTSLTTAEKNIVPLGTDAYQVTPVLLRFTGDVVAIENFITLIEGDAVGALEIKNTLLAPTEDGFNATVSVQMFDRPVDPSELDPEEQEALSRRVTQEELDAAAAAAEGGK